MIEFRSKYIDIEIEYAIRTRYIVHIGIYLVFIFDADHISNKPRFYSGEYIITNIAGEIGKFPSIFAIEDGSTQIQMILIVPEIRVFINMYEFKSCFKYSSSYRITPEVEGMIVIIKYYYILTQLHKILESNTWSEYTIFDLFENNIFSDVHIY